MIHRVRLFHSTTGAATFHAWLDTWITNMEPWADPEVSNDLPTEREALETGTAYYQTELAFEWSEDRSIILDQLDAYAASSCAWHRIAYHECGHDEDNGGPCSWDERRQSGSVPDFIPAVEP